MTEVLETPIASAICCWVSFFFFLKVLRLEPYVSMILSRSDL